MALAILGGAGALPFLFAGVVSARLAGGSFVVVQQRRLEAAPESFGGCLGADSIVPKRVLECRDRGRRAQPRRVLSAFCQFDFPQQANAPQADQRPVQFPARIFGGAAAEFAAAERLLERPKEQFDLPVILPP